MITSMQFIIVKIALFIVFSWVCHPTIAQSKDEYIRNRFKMMAEIPVQFGVGYEFNYSRRFSSNFQIGLLTQPNSSIVLYSLQALGTSQDVVLLLNDAFKSGVVSKGTLQYNFRKNYVGVFIQSISLKGEDTPTSVVENALNVSITSYPKYKGASNAPEDNLTLSSQLLQAGILYGRRFPIRKTRSEIDAEFGMGANIASSSSLSSKVRNLSALSDYTNLYLSSIYRSYAFIPSITIAYAVRIGK